jgi:predicted nuclease with TOPRIM domain
VNSKAILERGCALLAGVMLFLAGCDRQGAELAAQRQKELDAVRAELEQARAAAAAQEEELNRLRKDNAELLRLRNEVRQLRDEKQQFSRQAQTAQVQAAQAQAQVQAVQTQAQQAAQALAAQQQVNACLNNLRLLQAAKQQWALENKKNADATPSATELSPYLKGGIPKCPAGGAYAFNAVGVLPSCNIPGHALSQ